MTDKRQYTRRELRCLWAGFAGESDESERLAGFADCSVEQAAEMIKSFRTTAAARKAAERVIDCIGEDVMHYETSPVGKIKYDQYRFFHKAEGNSFMEPLVNTIDKPGFLDTEEIKPKEIVQNTDNGGGTDVLA